ncbi:MAG: rhomboid family intramembrane serine protease [Patescibacteria group bacterium]
MFPIKDHHPSGKFPFVNLGLIFTNIYIFFKELTVIDLNSYINTYALVPRNVDFSRPETLTVFITSLFLHAGFLHILSNMWFLWIFGDNVEARLGHVKYLVFYLFCGIAASFGQHIFISNSALPMLGASGAIAGVLGAYLHFFPKSTIDTLIPIFGFPTIMAIPASFMLIYWFITQAFSGAASIVVATASVGGVAYIAHAAGFLSGLIFSLFFTPRK